MSSVDARKRRNVEATTSEDDARVSLIELRDPPEGVASHHDEGEENEEQGTGEPAGPDHRVRPEGHEQYDREEEEGRPQQGKPSLRS
jgi:hypothetical protein